MSDGKPIIEIIDLHKSFGEHHVLKGITLSVPSGSTLVILGGSGSGKTVLMKHMIGLLKPDAGRVVIDGEDIVPMGAEELEKIRRKFGMVFQAAALFDSMTVYENVSFALREHRKELGETKMREIVREKLAIVGLKDVEDKFPANLSGGAARSEFFVQSLQSDLMLPCKAWNPTGFLTSELPQGQADDLEQLGPQLAVAIGAATTLF